MTQKQMCFFFIVYLYVSTTALVFKGKVCKIFARSKVLKDCTTLSVIILSKFASEYNVD